MVPQSWVVDWLKMYKISDKLIIFMKNYKVELTAGRKGLVELKIQKDIFMGDVLHYNYL